MNDKRDQPHYQRGDRIAGKYQLLRPLGVGGMGVVWVAHNLVLDVHVAVKLIRRHLAGALATERLLREARSAARISHPGIVRVFDFGTTEHGDPFIVMELLEGETLRDLYEREQRMDPLRAVATLLPVANALAALDGTGIVHRDMKPDNVILVRVDDERVQPKLVDFGVAIVPGMERLTQGGLIVGTPDYLAPEQAAGEDIDHRADVWAFAVCLFEAIAGQRPFAADAVPDLLNAILLLPAPSLTEVGGVDAELDAIVGRGLEKLRERRWSSMRSFAVALAAWARAQGLTEDITGASVRDRLSEPDAQPIPLLRITPTPEAIGTATTQITPSQRARRADGRRSHEPGGANGASAAKGANAADGGTTSVRVRGADAAPGPAAAPAPPEPRAEPAPEPRADAAAGRMAAGSANGRSRVRAGILVGAGVLLLAAVASLGSRFASSAGAGAGSGPGPSGPPAPSGSGEASAPSADPSTVPSSDPLAPIAPSSSPGPAIVPSALPSATSASPDASSSAQPLGPPRTPPTAGPSRLDDLKDPFRKGIKDPFKK